MALRPEEKREVLAALLQYQQSFGGGALAGMEASRQSEQQDTMRTQQLEDERRQATMRFLSGQQLGRGGEPLGVGEQTSLFGLPPEQIPEDITPYSPPAQPREFAPTDPSLQLQRQVGAISAIRDSWQDELRRINDRYEGGVAQLRAKIQANMESPKKNPVTEEERRDYRRYVDAERNMAKLRETMTGIVGGTAPDTQAQAPQGEILVVSPDGQQGYIPAGQLQAAIQQGYKRVQ